MSRRVRRVKGDIRFTVRGVPKPKASARVNIVNAKKKGRKAHGFKPAVSANWEFTIQGQSIQYAPTTPFTGPIALGVVFYRPYLKSKSKKWYRDAAAGIIRPTSKPDFKNLLANVEDALNEIFWLDDAQVVEIVDVDGVKSGKYYSDTPRIEILVRPLPTH